MGLSKQYTGSRNFGLPQRSTCKCREPGGPERQVEACCLEDSASLRPETKVTEGWLHRGVAAAGEQQQAS